MSLLTIGCGSPDTITDLTAFNVQSHALDNQMILMSLLTMPEVCPQDSDLLMELNHPPTLFSDKSDRLETLC